MISIIEVMVFFPKEHYMCVDTCHFSLPQTGLGWFFFFLKKAARNGDVIFG